MTEQEESIGISKEQLQENIKNIDEYYAIARAIADAPTLEEAKRFAYQLMGALHSDAEGCRDTISQLEGTNE